MGTSDPTGYDARDRERWVPEPGKDPRRSEFARDRARVLHSSALRRLGAKTQVLGAGTDDFVRNRLTHSLEVAQIGRELATALGCDADVVDAACLAHDLGHPPFGHNGEAALDEAAGSIGGFEGNAQTLRVLTRLEPKVVGSDGSGGERSAGLNLTRAVLDATSKYPWARREGTTKFGVYAEDRAVFDWLRAGAPTDRRCLEAQVMDLADDIAYSVHDLEDGIVAGTIALEQVDVDRTPYWEFVANGFVPGATDAGLDEAWEELRRQPYWPQATFDGGRAALVAVKDFASQLIGRFCSTAVAATRVRHADGPLVRYAADLVVPEGTAREIGLLQGLGVFHVSTSADRRAERGRERALITDLVTALVEQPERMTPAFAADLDEAPDDAARLRAVIDQVSSLTDASARRWHARLLGDARSVE